MALRSISLTSFTAVGEGLAQPSCVAVARDGRVFVAHDRSRLSIIRPDGIAKAFADLHAEITAMAFDARGALLIGLSNAQGVGALCRHDLAGGVPKVVFSKVEDRAFRAIHGLFLGEKGTLYGVLSSRLTWQQAFEAMPKPSGALFEMKQGMPPEVLARGLQFPKGLVVNPGDHDLFVMQALCGDILRFEFRDFGGGVQAAQPFGAPLGNIPEVCPDAQTDPKQRRRLGLLGGCAIDAERNIWVCLPWANKIVAVTPTSALMVVADDPYGQMLKGPANIAFGGPDLTNVYIACSDGTHVATAKSPVPGLALIHQR